MAYDDTSNVTGSFRLLGVLPLLVLFTVGLLKLDGSRIDMELRQRRSS